MKDRRAAFCGKTVLITGTSSGIGYAVAEKFLAAGARVYGISRRAIYPAGMNHVSLDLEDEQALRTFVETFLAEHGGPPDLLILNAGYGISGPIETSSVDLCRRQFQINYFSGLILLESLLPSMRKTTPTKERKILFVSSAAAFFPLPFQAQYAASKAALTSLVRALAAELHGSGANIRVSALLPGDVSTGFTSGRVKCDAKATLDYPAYARSISRMEKDERDGKDATWVAERLFRLALKRHPKSAYVPGWNYKVLYLLQRLLPLRFVDYLLRKLYAE